MNAPQKFKAKSARTPLSISANSYKFESKPMNCITRPVNFIHFHGLTLLVVEHEGREFVPLKPLSDLAGIDWRSAKRSMEHPENVTLMGAKWLKSPVFAGHGGDMTPTPDTLFIQLDRARLYLARINTARMKAQGNVDGAEVLLTLQIEWAEALHAYETTGMAVKKGHREGLSTLMGLIKARTATTSPAERTALTALIANAFEDLGQPLPAQPQQELPGV